MTLSRNSQERLHRQYRDAGNLNARITLHQRYSTNRYGWYRWLMDHFLALPGNARILELGCGPATVWAGQGERIPTGWTLALSDFSAGMVRKAKETLSGQGCFRFLIQDAQGLSFPTGYFDAVIANHMLYHVTDRRKALREIRRVLRPGGVFFAATNGPRHMAELTGLIQKVLPGLDSAVAENSMQRLTAAFSLENGQEQLSSWFASVQMERYPDGLEITEAKPLADYILSMTFIFEEATRIGLEEISEKITHEAAGEIQRRGSMHITKDTGLFIARR